MIFWVTSKRSQILWSLFNQFYLPWHWRLRQDCSVGAAGWARFYSTPESSEVWVVTEYVIDTGLSNQSHKNIYISLR